MVCATVMNSVGAKKEDGSVWQPDDFIGRSKPDSEEPRMQSAEEIYALMMHYMPPQIQ